MESGEIFGELSLILGEKRKASIKAIIPSEIIEIKKNALEAILLSSNLELHKVIQQMSKELGKDSDHKLPITQKDLKVMVASSPDVIRALAFTASLSLISEDFSVKRVKHGETNKVLMLEEEILFNQGDPGDKAYMVVSGRLAVIVDKKEVGYMGDGEVFGELALLLNQKRSATVKSLKPTELIEIDRSGLDKILNSASSNVKSMMLNLCEELSKRNEFQKIPFSVNELNLLIEEENDLITKFARQIFYRLDNQPLM